jgi:hypothetical protein
MRRFEFRSLWIAAWIICCACFSIVGCSKPKPPVAAPPAKVLKAAPATPIDRKKIELGGTTWDPQWDVLVEERLSGAMLSRRVPRDVRHFCPHFYEMQNGDKRAFWAYFFQALAGAEAGLDPTTNVRHGEATVARRDEVTHVTVRSEGLLQLAYEDSKRYGCDFDWKSDRLLKSDDPARTILQPKNNLDCGVRILENQIIVHHKPLLSSSGYWSTLRPGSASYRVFAKQMTNPPLACGLHEKVVQKTRTEQVSER